MVTGIGHLAFAVKDLEKSLEFYCDKLGFEKMFVMTNDAGAINTQYIRIAYRQYIELFPMKEGQNPPTQSDEVSYKHLCIHVDNVQNTFDELSAKGVEFFRPIKLGISKCIQVWTKDPDGNQIEFMELPENSLQYINDHK